MLRDRVSFAEIILLMRRNSPFHIGFDERVSHAYKLAPLAQGIEFINCAV
jgi:hypothetical protein